MRASARPKLREFEALAAGGGPSHDRRRGKASRFSRAGDFGWRLAKLLNRYGVRLAVLSEVAIDYPVGRAGARFEAVLPSAALVNLDATRLRYFVVQDDSGNRYPAVIERIRPESAESTRIFGALVAHG